MNISDYADLIATSYEEEVVATKPKLAASIKEAMQTAIDKREPLTLFASIDDCYLPPFLLEELTYQYLERGTNYPALNGSLTAKATVNRCFPDRVDIIITIKGYNLGAASLLEEARKEKE